MGAMYAYGVPNIEFYVCLRGSQNLAVGPNSQVGVQECENDNVVCVLSSLCYLNERMLKGSKTKQLEFKGHRYDLF